MQTNALPFPLWQPLRLPTLEVSAAQPVIKWLLLILLFILSPSLALAQLLKGKVVDAQHPTISLAGATIRLPGEKQGTLTDSMGGFSIQAGHVVSFIRVSFLGYQTQTVPIRGDNTNLTIALEPGEALKLMEVTVISKYYRQYVTNAISSALRLKTTLLDLPQNIQIVTPELIFDQGSFNLTENVGHNVSGVVRQELSNNLGP